MTDEERKSYATEILYAQVERVEFMSVVDFMSETTGHEFDDDDLRAIHDLTLTSQIEVSWQ